MSTEILIHNHNDCPIFTAQEILDYLAFERKLSGEGFFKGVD